MGTIINAQIVYSKCMSSIITAPLCMKFLIDLAAQMMCLSNSSLSNTTHCNLAQPTTINNESTIFQGDDDMHDNDDSSNSKVVDNDSNCLRDSSDSN